MSKPSRLLLIDSDTRFRNSIKRALAREVPDMAVYEHDPAKDGAPTRNFNWITYDLVLLDYRFCQQHNMQWLAESKQAVNFPIILMLTGTRPQAFEKAKAMGADATLNKRQITRSQLAAVIQHGLEQAELRRQQNEKIMRDSSGLRISGYRIIEKLAEGGMSSIYLAQRSSDDEKVVIKILYSESIDDDSFVHRFLQEYEIISRLNDRNIVKIHAQSYTEDFMYMVMEYFPHGDLHQKIKANEGLPLSQALQYLVQIASGLNTIHSCGIIHRDLKPSNIMFRNDDSLAIIDFGISKELGLADQITNENIVMGTVGYMSPESGQGKPVDARSDIYQLGHYVL